MTTKRGKKKRAQDLKADEALARVLPRSVVKRLRDEVERRDPDPEDKPIKERR